jgi:hypothetical protein
VNPIPPRRKHEKDHSQDRIDYAAAFGFRSDYRGRRYYAIANVLPQSLPSSIKLFAVSGWFKLATHR